MNWLRLTLTRKFALLLIGFLVLQLAPLPARVAAALGAGLVVLGLLMVRRGIVRPLRDMNAITRAIADGAYDRRVERDSSDELGELAHALNRTAAAIGDKTDRLRALNEVALVVTSSLALDEVLQQILLYGMPLSGAQAISIAFYDQAARRFEQRITRGMAESMIGDMAFPPEAVAEEVMRRGDYVVCGDGRGSIHALPAMARAQGITAIICLPLVGGGKTLGVIYFLRCDQTGFAFEDIELIQTFSRLAGLAIQNARVHESTVDLAETDALTGLYNRRKLDARLREEIQRSQRLHHPLALLMLDADHFKAINDQHGHDAGDRVLRTLAAVFKRELRDIDLLVRAGGEEFVFLLPGSDGEEALRVAERLRTAVANQAIALDGTEYVNVTVSLGVACYPGSAESAEALMQQADRALYVAKHQGRNRSIRYTDAAPASNVVFDLAKKRPDRGG